MYTCTLKCLIDRGRKKQGGRGGRGVEIFQNFFISGGVRIRW